jgi:membrane associated rhomboid family serine protease
VVLPFADVNPTRRPAVVTWLLLLTNAVVFFTVQAPAEVCEANALVYRFGAIPRELLAFEALSGSDLQRLLGECAVAVDADKSVALSLVTAMFLHGNLAHLAGNMLFLWIFGNNVEDRLGRGRFVAFYLVGGIAATAAFAALRPGSIVPLVGASGAIAAILGAYLICFPRAQVLTYVPFPLYLLTFVIPSARMRSFWLLFAIVTVPAWLVLGGWFALQAVAARSPVSSDVAYEAHVAGFVAGIVLLLVLDRRRRRHGQPTFHPVRRS